MSNILDLLKKSGVSVQEFSLIEEVGIEYWHSLFIQNGSPISGGFGTTKHMARKIAYAEFLERKKYRDIFNNPELRHTWGIDLIPTACGFAAGFDKNNTINRSLAESIERWTMSKWIDDHFLIEQTTPTFDSTTNLENRICNWFLKQFDQVLFFEKEIVVQFNNEFRKIKVAQTMGLKKDGIFPGSSAQSANGNIWLHALLESFRHYLIIKNGNDFSKFPYDKVKYFSQNAPIALKAISQATNDEWPTPHIKYFNYEFFQDEKFHLARVIVDGWKSWDSGPLERFLY